MSLKVKHFPSLPWCINRPQVENTISNSTLKLHLLQPALWSAFSCLSTSSCLYCNSKYYKRLQSNASPGAIVVEDANPPLRNNYIHTYMLYACYIQFAVFETLDSRRHIYHRTERPDRLFSWTLAGTLYTLLVGSGTEMHSFHCKYVPCICFQHVTIQQRSTTNNLQRNTAL